MEHIEWCPKGYNEGGLSGQRIAIAGHSHSSDGSDHVDATCECLTNVISGDWSIAFFNAIPRYFGFDDQSAFWSNVMFFNFLPTMVGTRDEKFGYGRPDQLNAGRTRVLRLLDEHRPDKMFVFSTKGWREFPPTVEDITEKVPQPPYYWHTYQTHSGHQVRAVGLRHPQGADMKKMSAQVHSLMSS